MLALSESESRRLAGKQRQKTPKKRSRYDKDVDKDVDNVAKQHQDSLQLHELMPVQYKPEEQALHATQIAFDPATITQQNCQTVVSLEGMNSVSNSNKFVIITLLEPEPHANDADEITNGDGTSDQAKLQKKVILLHKIEPQVTDAIDTGHAAIQPLVGVTKGEEIKTEYNGQMLTINFGDFASSTDGTDQKDIFNWIKRFQSLQLLYTETGKPYVKCPACTAMFFKASSFEKHVSCHLSKENERYVCNFCKYGNEDPSEIFTHMFIHQDQCEVCNMNLTRKNSFKKHWQFSESSTRFTVKRDRWARFVCIYCKLGFDLCHQLQKHWFKHSCNSRKTAQCKECSGLFDTNEALQNHVCLKCPVCGKICDSVHRLRSHTRYEKHYLYCQICSYEFILAVDHEKHMALHKKVYHTHKDYAHCLESEDSTSFQCEICAKIYHTMSALVLHIHDDHKLPEAIRGLGSGEIERLSLPEVKNGDTPYDIINHLKGDLKCEVEFQRTCEEVLEAETDGTTEKPDSSGTNERSGQCQPVALCWDRYSIHDQSVTKAT